MDEGTPREDKGIQDKVFSVRVSLDVKDAPLPEVVDFLHQVSGVQIRITGIDQPDKEIISLKASDVVLDGMLRLLLGPRQLAYAVRDGVILITKIAVLMKEVTLELYDVKDLTFGMKDFPDADLLPVRGGAIPPAEIKPRTPELPPAPPSREAPAATEATDAESRTRRLLEAIKLDIDLSESSPAVVLAFLRNYTELEFAVEDNVKALLEGSKASGFKSRDLSLRDALGQFLEGRGLEFQVDPHGTIVIARHLVTGEDLAARVKESTGRGEWRESEGKSIQFQDGLLIVRNRS